MHKRSIPIEQRLPQDTPVIIGGKFAVPHGYQEVVGKRGKIIRYFASNTRADYYSVGVCSINGLIRWYVQLADIIEFNNESLHSLLSDYD